MKSYIEMGMRHLNIAGCGARVGNILWASELERNGLYKIDLQSKCTQFVDKFPIAECRKPFYDVIYENGELIFIPFRADVLLIYNIKREEFRSIVIKSSEEEKFTVGILEEGIVYLFPYRGNRIAKVDLVQGKVTYENRIIRCIKKNLAIEELFSFGRIYKKEIYLTLRDRNIIIKYDIEGNAYESYDFGGQEFIEVTGCIIVDRMLYLIDSQGILYIFNLVTKSYSEMSLLGDGTINPFGDIVNYRNELWFIPYNSRSVAVYDIQKKVISHIDISKYINVPKETVNLFSKAFADSEKVIMYPRNADVIVMINLRTRRVETESCIIQIPFERNPTLGGFINEIYVETGIPERREMCGNIIWNATGKNK